MQHKVSSTLGSNSLIVSSARLSFNFDRKLAGHIRPAVFPAVCVSYACSFTVRLINSFLWCPTLANERLRQRTWGGHGHAMRYVNPSRRKWYYLVAYVYVFNWINGILQRVATRCANAWACCPPAWRVKMRIKVFEVNKCYYVKSLIEYLPYCLSVRPTVCHSGICVCACVCNQFA